MTMVSSGAISLAGSCVCGSLNRSVEKELGGSGTSALGLGCSSVRTLAGVASGAISLSNLYGKSNYTPALRVSTSTVVSGATFTVPSGTPSGTTYTYLIVGGGGGSAGFTSKSSGSKGGGGAGQVLTGTFTVSASQVITYTIGAGGSTSGGSGASSTIQTSTLSGGSTVTASGGGGTVGNTGGSSGSGNAGYAGNVGGSGGGGGQGGAGGQSLGGVGTTVVTQTPGVTALP